MRRFAIVAASVVALLILALLAAPQFINVDHFRPKIQSELETKLKRKVQIGGIRLGVFPPGVRVNDVEIGESPSMPSQQPFAKAKEVYATVAVFSLLRGQPDLKSVRLEKPQIELIRDASGVWNFSSLVSSSDTEHKSSLDSLQIYDGQVSVTDLANHQPRTTYDHIDLTLSDFAPGKRLALKLAAHLSGQGKQLIAADGKIGPLKPENLAGTPVDAHISLQEVSLASARQLGVQAIPEGTDAVASGEANIRTDNGRYKCAGKLKLDKATVKNVQLGFPIEADYKIDADPDRSVLRMEAVNLRIGPTPLSASGELDASHAPAQMNMRVSTQNAPLAQLARLASAFGVAFNPKYTVNGNLSANLTAQGAATKPSLAGSLILTKLEVAGSELKQPVRVPELNLTLSPDEIRSNPFQAESGGTRVSGLFTITRYTSPDPFIDGSLKTDGANLTELLAMAKAYGVTAMEGANGSGSVSVDVRVQGPVARPSALTYAGSGSLANVVLNVPSLSKPVQMKSAALRFQQDAVAVENFAGSLAGSDLRGTVKVKNFSAPQLDFDLSSDKIDTAELEQLSTTRETAPANQPKEGGGLMEKVSGSGTLSAGTILARSVVLTNVKAKCLLDRGVIRLNPVSSNLFGGTQTGMIEADMRRANPGYSLNTKLSGVDVNKLLSATTSLKDSLTGVLTASGDLKFIQEPGGEIARTLNGDVTFDVANGHVKNLNILNELSKIGKFVRPAAQGNTGTDLKRLSGTLHMVNGVANTDNLVAMLDAGSLSAKGSINLVNQALDLHMTAVLASSLSQSVGGSQIGGYLNTALSNKKGELVLPVIVTGTLANPSFAPDAESMAKMKLQNLLPTSGNPSSVSSAIEGALGNLGGKTSGQQKATDTDSTKDKQPEDALKSILKGFEKKPKKQ
jgi:uncharacterized protein involved in outer membrane biogenesis